MSVSLRILHIEDDLLTRELVKDALGSEMVVDGAGSIEEALKLLATEVPYDVVLLDLDLPDAIGTDAVAALNGYGIPIVLLSASYEVETLGECLARGAVDYVDVINRADLVKRLWFAHARSVKMARDGSRSPYAQSRIRASVFESLKPFITCGSELPLTGH